MTPSQALRHGLVAATEMAAMPDAPVTVAETARRHGLPAGALAKAFQRLVRSGIARGTRGVGGGYRLARPAAAVTVLDVVAAFERELLRDEDPFGTARGPTAPGEPMRRLRALFARVDEVARATLSAVSLAAIVAAEPPPELRSQR